MAVDPSAARAIHLAEQAIAATNEVYRELLRPFFIGYFEARERGLTHAQCLDVGKALMGQLTADVLAAAKEDEERKTSE